MEHFTEDDEIEYVEGPLTIQEKIAAGIMFVVCVGGIGFMCYGIYKFFEGL